MKQYTDEEIGSWSLRKFKTNINQQKQKLREEEKEMMFELADMWIVICGIVYRGSKTKYPTYEEFCKKYSVNPKKLRFIINEKLTICKKRPYIENNKGVLKRMKTAEEIKAIMLKKAEERGVVPSATFEKLVNFRARQNIDVSICPCSPNDKERGCISDKCCQEILETGTCHCRAFIRQGLTTLR
jgi:hypothetical protein